MGFRYYKRVKLGKGFGLNISKSSIRPSYQSEKGSISSKGFSLRTGIPGLSYRKNFSRSSSKGCLVVFMLVVFLALVVSCTDSTEECESRRCSDFQTQSEAQLEFDLNPECYRDLDSDNDGIPCENLPD